MKKTILLSIIIFAFSSKVIAQKDTIRMYGPGGPFLPMREVADNFEKKHNTKIIISKGPMNNWKDQAKLNADLFFSGSENMMTSIVNNFQNEVSTATVYPMFYRKSGLIVRKGNPKKIHKIEDLQQTNLKIMVVNEAGLIGVWEDMLGKLKDMKTFRTIRSNIISYANNSAVAEKNWKENKNIDVWITWNIWQMMNAETSEFITLKDKYTIYRDCGIVLSKNGEKEEKVKLFYEYLKSAEAEKIFNKFGWK